MTKYILSLLLLIISHCYSPCFAQSNTPWQRLDTELQKARFFPINELVCIVGNTGCLLISADSGATWKQPFTGTLHHLRAIDFATPSVGVVVGYDGVISRTNDGGITWKIVPSPTKNILNSVQFVSESEGFAAGINSTLLKTEDAGLSWQTMDFQYSFSINMISMDSPKTGIIAGDGSNFLKTVDGGLHWQPQVIDNLPIGFTEFKDCIRVDGKTYFYGNNSFVEQSVLVTSDNGSLYSASLIPIANDIAVANDTIYTISTAGGISKSSLQFLQFTSVPLSDTTYPVVFPYANKNSLCFVSKTIALAVGDRKFIYRTQNIMDSWSLISYVSGYSYNDPILSSPAIYNVKFVNDSIGYLVGALRAIYHTTNGGATWLPQRTSSIALYDLNDISITSYPISLAVGSNSSNSVIKTIDGGRTFIPNDTIRQGYLPVGDRPKISFWKDSLGLITGSGGSSAKGIINLSNDSGKTWKVSIIKDVGITDSRWVDDSTILLSGDKVMISRDRGLSWDSTSFPFPQRQLGCWAIDSKNLLVTGGYTNKPVYYGLIFRSADGGRTWKIVDSSISRYSYHAISFSDEKIGYTINRSLMQTKDGGNKWKAIAENPLDTGYFVRLAALPDGNVVITTSQPHMVIRSNFDESVLAVDEPKTMIDNIASVWLYSPRPVPASGKITLNAVWLSSINASTIRIKLYDMLGIELQDITDSFHANSGVNTGIVEFDGSKLPTGIYCIEINGGGYRKAVPVIIAR